ncbi:MAG: carboxypeptidase-like regulatory domain-containing protein, partial [Balneolales bacterium]
MYRILIRNLAVIVLIGLAAPPLFAQQQLTSVEPLVSDANLVQLQKNIELNITNRSMEDALVSIAEEANLKLMYSKALLPKEERITLNKKSISLYDALWTVLDGSDLRFAISENQLLVLMKNSEEEKMLSEKVIIQETISGQVTDAETGETLPGVNVVIEGTSTGTTTNLDGEYDLEVTDSDAILVFTYVGYATQEIAVGDRDAINVSLESDFA